MTELVAAYLEIALSGAKADDPRLAVLVAAMTNEELEVAKRAIGAEILRREPAERPN
jgi:hypothetical protein